MKRKKNESLALSCCQCSLLLGQKGLTPRGVNVDGDGADLQICKDGILIILN